jgi:hypothetical protein
MVDRSRQCGVALSWSGEGGAVPVPEEDRRDENLRLIMRETNERNRANLDETKLGGIDPSSPHGGR